MVPWLGSGERLGELCSYDLELKDPLNPKLSPRTFRGSRLRLRPARSLPFSFYRACLCIL